MSRVTPTEVKALVPTKLLDDIVQVWINGASAIVDSNIDCIVGDKALLTQVELFLSAHFVAMLSTKTRGFVTTRELASTFKTQYSDPVKLKNTIDNTFWGTTANMLSGGCLANTSDKLATVEFF